MYLNAGPAVVDANFSGLWPTKASALNKYALLALMNSTWTAANLEVTASVMGGGALKVEAAHLRRLLLPVPTGAELERLTQLGRELCSLRGTASGSDSRVLSTVDAVVDKLLCRSDQSLQFNRLLSGLLESRMQQRSPASMTNMR